MIGKNAYNRVEQKINYLSYNINPFVFIYMRLISSLILFLVLLFCCKYGYIIAPVITIIYYILIEYFVLDKPIKIRSKILENDSLEFFPILLLALKGGRNIRKSLVYTTYVVKNDLSLEFEKVLYDEKIGKSLDEALMRLRTRIPSELVVNMVISIIEANRLGNNINDSINKQLSYVEERKNHKILNSYKIIPLKMALLSLLFVFGVLLLLLISTM